MVDAKELHEFLGIKTRLDKWISRRIEEYGFTQGTDFITAKNDRNYIKDLQLTIDMAKELCMVERNEKGREARKYFIQIEKAYNERYKGKTKIQILADITAKMAEAEQRQLAAQKQVRENTALLEEHEIKLKLLSSDTGYSTVRGYCIKNKIKFIGQNTSISIGKKASKECRKRDFPIYKVADERNGEVNSYPTEILDFVFRGQER